MIKRRRPITVLIADDNEEQAEIISRWVLEASLVYFSKTRACNLKVSGLSVCDGSKRLLQINVLTDPRSTHKAMRSGYVDVAFVDYRWPGKDGGVAGKFCLCLFDNKSPNTTAIVMSHAHPISARISSKENDLKTDHGPIGFCIKDAISVAKALTVILDRHDAKSLTDRGVGALRRLWYDTPRDVVVA